MDGLNSNTNYPVNDEKSSSFILQPCLNDEDQEEYSPYELKAPLLISSIYENEFYNHFHINYSGELEHEGLFLASLRSIPIKSGEADLQLVRVLIRTETNNYNISEIVYTKYEKYFLQILFDRAHLSPIHHYQSIDYIRANEKLLEFDKSIDEQYSNKVGLIYQRADQINENEILSNNSMPIEMENFLKLISDRVELKDFDSYRGDLDTKSNEHGIHSYFIKFENHQIMFNVAPMIPSDSNDQDFIPRKSLIANALLCIVFQEKGTQTFNPNLMRGKVTQVYITVQPVEKKSELYYKIEIWRRCDIETITDPESGMWKCSQSFRNDFLILILNTITSILKKEFFQKRIGEQRQRLKNQSIQKLSQFFYSYSKNHPTTFDNSSDEDILKPAGSKRHRHSIIPKILATFSSNRTLGPTQSMPRGRSSLGNLQDDPAIIAINNNRAHHFLGRKGSGVSTANIINSTEELNI